MNNTNRPEMTPLSAGADFKALQVTAKAGMIMPEHHATHEAVIVVKSGESILKIHGKNHNLKAGDTFILPAKQDHSLEVVQDFLATVILPKTAEIKFPE